MKLPNTLKAEALDEAYEYFDNNVRPLSKLNNKVNPAAPGLEDNDADAFRYAYVSGVFTQEYSESAADIFGQINEIEPGSFYSNSNNPRAKNMDFWNNVTKPSLFSKKTGMAVTRFFMTSKSRRLCIKMSSSPKYRQAITLTTQSQI